MKDSKRWRRAGHWGMAAFSAAMLGAIGCTWFFTEAQRQDKWIRTAIFGMALYAGFLAWLALASRWRARLRWTIFLGTIAAIVFCRFALRISGVTGDLLPIVEWRWTSPAAATEREALGAPHPAIAGRGTGDAHLGNVIPSTNSYPQFLGPARDGTVSGPPLARDWNQNPPRELWRHAVGAAWSGFAVLGNFAVTQEQRGREELVACYDALTGTPVWSHADESRYATTIAGEGPRATPTIFGDRVYTMGGAGLLNCLDLATGQVLWRTNTLAAHGAKLPEWGVACSPLVTERAVFVTVGGRNSSMVAYGRKTGVPLWADGHDDVHWSSPLRAVFDGVPQVVIFAQNVGSFDEQTGKALWQYPWPNSFPHVAAPLLLSSNRLLISQGYGGGSELIQVTHAGPRWKTTRLWKSIRLKSKFANLIYRDGFVYGLDDGALVCIDVETGGLKWKGERYGHGQMILTGDVLLLTAENGEIVLVEPSPDEPRERARFKVFNAKMWNPPALAGDLLFVRNDREAACLRLTVAQ